MRFFVLALFTLLLSMNGCLCNEAEPGDAAKPSPTCKSYPCPAYVAVHKEEDIEIRRYNRSVWMSTSEIMSTSFKEATREGFLKLYAYVKGKNKEQQNVTMTAPILTDVFLSSGSSPSCMNSSFVVMLSMAEEFQERPPTALDGTGLHAQRWDVRCTAVRAFGGFAKDENIVEEAKKLRTTLLTTSWGSVLARKNDSRGCLSKDEPSVFSVVQYNSPFENHSRVNEIWLPLENSKKGNCE